MTQATVVSFLLDETGSMMSVRDDTIGGFNAYVGDLRKADEGHISFSLVKFDSNRIEKVCVGVPIADVPELTTETYIPRAMTPLIDAAYKTITATREHVEARDDDPNVVVVIQTDGHENASTQYKRHDLAALIKEMTAKGWQFVFLGADIDAFQEAGSWGISRDTTASYGKVRTAQTFSTMAGKTMSYAASGNAADLRFTEAERAKMAGGDGKKQEPPMAAKRQAVVDDFTL